MKSRHCLACDYAHFPTSPPLTGECRRNPPRSHLENRDGKPGRFFATVRHDDWCGQFRESANPEQVRAATDAVAPYLSPRAKIALAERMVRMARYDDAISLFEAAFESDLPDATLAFRIAQCHRQKARGPSRDAFDWFARASELGHAEAAFWLGLNYAQGDIVEQDLDIANDFLNLSAERGFARAVNKLGEGGFTTPYEAQVA